MKKVVHNIFFNIYPVLCIVLLNVTGCALDVEQSKITQQASVCDDIDRGPMVSASCVVEADSYASVGDKTLYQIQEDAKENARKKAEKYIRSKQKDIGNIEINEPKILESKPERKDGYDYVKIKAEVPYRFRLKNIDTLNIDVRMPKDIYKLLEKIEIHIRGNKDYHAWINMIDPDNNRIELLPEKLAKTFIFKAGKMYRIPDDILGEERRMRKPGDYKILITAKTLSEGERGEATMTTPLSDFEKQLQFKVEK